jgi:hypothetical protein
LSIPAATIAQVLKADPAGVEAVWPLVVAALGEQGILSRNVEIAAAATIRVEVGAAFRPIKERRANQAKQPQVWALQNRYWASGFYGRGLVQITWDENYRTVGKRLNLDLVGNPDLALDPGVSARILADFFRSHGIHLAADAGLWSKVRRRVNGGEWALDEFLGYVADLLEVGP